MGTKVLGETLGCELDPLDGEVLQVCGLRESSLLKVYNSRCSNKERQVLPGDFVVSINGVHGNTEAMIDRVKSDDKIQFTMRRLKTWEVVLDQKAVSIRPSVNRASNSRSLLLLDTEDPSIMLWN